MNIREYCIYILININRKKRERASVRNLTSEPDPYFDLYPPTIITTSGVTKDSIRAAISKKNTIRA